MATGGKGCIRCEAINIPRYKRRRDEVDPGITLWEGPKAQLITAHLPEVDTDALQIILTDASLIFNGSILSKPMQRKAPSGRTQNKSKSFNHAVKPPFRVESELVEVQKENGLITVILKRKAPETASDSQRRDHASFMNSVNHFFAKNGQSSFGRTKETICLRACERYLEYNERNLNR
jgi:HSP20 family molecular chaperone IbpA